MFNRDTYLERARWPITEGRYAGTGWWPAPEPADATCVARFDPIGLDQMAGVALLDRAETKYVFHERRLEEILEAPADDYRVLEINGVRSNHYRSLYFDTEEFALFHRHHAGGRNRYKVRSRNYVDTGLSFLEVKHKINKGRTVKNRIRTVDFVDQMSSRSADFLDEYLPNNVRPLEPKLWNEYTRITLVGKNNSERVTLDLNLRFRHAGQRRDDRTVILPGVVIAEVKRDGCAHHNTAFMRCMRDMTIRPTGFSKYCIGVSMLYTEVKHNRFKPQLRMVEKLVQENYYVR